MLRALAIALLAANLLYFGWSLGWLDALVGIRAQGDREPERISRQVRPELMTVTAVDAANPSDAAATGEANTTAAAAAESGKLQAATASAATLAAKVGVKANICLEAGPFNPNELTAAETAIRAAAPNANWTQRQTPGSGEWMIYMGPYPDDAWIERKKSELSRIRGGMPYELVNSPPQLARGLSLGRFPSQAEADKRLDQQRLRGIRTARVVKSGDGPPITFLRVAQADEALAAGLATVKWPAGRSGFADCPQ